MSQPMSPLSLPSSLCCLSHHSLTAFSPAVVVHCSVFPSSTQMLSTFDLGMHHKAFWPTGVQSCHSFVSPSVPSFRPPSAGPCIGHLVFGEPVSCPPGGPILSHPLPPIPTNAITYSWLFCVQLRNKPHFDLPFTSVTTVRQSNLISKVGCHLLLLPSSLSATPLLLLPPSLRHFPCFLLQVCRHWFHFPEQSLCMSSSPPPLLSETVIFLIITVSKAVTFFFGSSDQDHFDAAWPSSGNPLELATPRSGVPQSPC